MTKKEREQVEVLLTEAALRRTSPVEPDVPVPVGTGALSVGFLPTGERGYDPQVLPACSSAVDHGIGSQDKVSTQGARRLYSSRLLALQALRYEVETECARRLRKIDRMIEEELRGGH